MKARSIASLLSIVAATFLFSGCATEPSLYTGEKAYYGYTWEQELKLGREADAGIVQEMGLYPSDEISEYVRELGESLLVHSALRQPDAPELYRDTQFTFRVLDSPVVNAFALPGGYVYVTRGLLAHVQNEAQLAVVLGHEITHVEARHASKQALKQTWGQVGLLAGAVIGEQFAENKELARKAVEVSGSLLQLATLKYGRDAERESDLRGVEYAAKAGYDASQGSEFFRSLKRISNKSGQRLPSWMSSHPDPGEREETIKRLADEWSETQNMNTVGRERYLAKIDGLVVGENPRNGYIDGNTFYHPELRLQFEIPSGWKAQNESSAVYLRDPSGAALLVFSLARQSSPAAAAQALQQRLSLVPTYARETRIDGLEAYVLAGQAQSDSQTLPIYSTFIAHRDKVYSFLGYGNAEKFPEVEGRIRNSINSFQELKNRQALDIQPSRLSIVRAPRNAPFSELLPKRLPHGTDAQDWAIMNQVELDERMERGRLLKLP